MARASMTRALAAGMNASRSRAASSNGDGLRAWATAYFVRGLNEQTLPLSVPSAVSAAVPFTRICA